MGSPGRQNCTIAHHACVMMICIYIFFENREKVGGVILLVVVVELWMFSNKYLKLKTMPTIIVNVEHRGHGMNFPELRFQGDITIEKMKMNLMMKTGTEPQNMELSVIYDNESKEEVLLADDTKTLDDYDIVSG